MIVDLLMGIVNIVCLGLVATSVHGVKANSMVMPGWWWGLATVAVVGALLSLAIILFA